MLVMAVVGGGGGDGGDGSGSFGIFSRHGMGPNLQGWWSSVFRPWHHIKSSLTFFSIVQAVVPGRISLPEWVNKKKNLRRPTPGDVAVKGRCSEVGTLGGRRACRGAT